MSDNPYQAPQSQLEVTNNASHELNPNWQLDAVLSEAWQLTNGFKASYWGALIIYVVIQMIATFVLKLLGDSAVMLFISQLILAIITYPLAIGLSMLAVRRSVNLPCNATMVFDYYPKTIPIFLTYLVMAILIVIGFLLLIIPGIYLAVAASMTMMLLVDKNLHIKDAIKTSIETIHQCWFRTFAFYIVAVLIVLVSIIPLGIGLIWSLPLVTLGMAIIYRNLFGVSQAG